MSAHNISLHPAYMNGEEETLLDIVDALNAAGDVAAMLAIAATTLPLERAGAFGTTAMLLQEAIVDITGRVDNIRTGRNA